MNLEDCLPAALRGPSTTISPVAAGWSGASVYRVDAGGEAFVLKVSAETEPVAEWRRKIGIEQLAADAAVAPRVVHVDESRRAVVSAFIADRSFPMLYVNLSTRDHAIALLGRTLRRVHDLPLPAGASALDPRAFLANLWAGLSPAFPMPGFVADAAQRALAQPPPAHRPPVLSHNDVNPTNLVFDGEHLLLLDWNTAGPNDPLYDLAVIAMFLRMDDTTCARLVAAHDDAAITELPAGFLYLRRVAAIMCGVMFLQLARQAGHTGAAGGETLDATPGLDVFYQRMRAGELNPATADGRWAFGLALVKTSYSL